jgi:hypothetical protein
MIAFIIAFALDTIPVKPLPVLLPRPVKSEKTKSNDKIRKTNNDSTRVVRVCPAVLVSR